MEKLLLWWASNGRIVLDIVGPIIVIGAIICIGIILGDMDDKMQGWK